MNIMYKGLENISFRIGIKELVFKEFADQEYYIAVLESIGIKDKGLSRLLHTVKDPNQYLREYLIKDINKGLFQLSIKEIKELPIRTLSKYFHLSKLYKG